jgi:hypothetical protein
MLIAFTIDKSLAFSPRNGKSFQFKKNPRHPPHTEGMPKLAKAAG